MESNITKPAFRSPYVSGKIKAGVLPLYVTCKEIDFAEEIDKATQEMMRVSKLARNSETQSERNKINEEVEDIRLFIASLKACYQGHFRNFSLAGLFQNLEDWSQALKLDSKIIGTIPQSVSAKKDDEGRVTGRGNVIATLSKQLGVGTPAKQTLPDSMITVQIGNITDKSLVRLMMELNDIRNGHGFNTKGSMYSSTDCKLVSTITEFCLSHVVASTLRETNFETLMEVLRVSDIQALAAVTLKSIYPQGYPFLYSCVNTDDCTFKTYGDPEDPNFDKDIIPKLDYGRVVWNKVSKFDDARHRFLSASYGTHTLEQVLDMQARYLEEEEIGPFSDQIDTKVTMKVAIPLFKDYRRVGDEWLSDIVSSVESAIRKTNSESSVSVASKKRIEYINTMINKLSMQKEASWITEIKTESPEGEITKYSGESDILAALETLTAIDDIASNSIKIFIRAKNRATSTMTGIPMFKCPKCGTVQEGNADDHEMISIIPRNVIADFSYIMALKHQVF